MVPVWLRSPHDLPDGTAPVTGVAIGITDAPNLQLHAGLIHADQGVLPHVLHLGWHGSTSNERLPHAWIPFWWVALPISGPEAETLAMLCRRIASRVQSPNPALRLQVPYGLLYDGGRVRDDGSTEFAGREIGFTCSTFILAVLENLGITFLALDTWHPRPSDALWHRRIVSMLWDTVLKNPVAVPYSHIAGVERELGCVRYRPEEVAAACRHWPPAVTLADVRKSAHEILHALLPGVVD